LMPTFWAGHTAVRLLLPPPPLPAPQFRSRTLLWTVSAPLPSLHITFLLSCSTVPMQNMTTRYTCTHFLPTHTAYHYPPPHTCSRCLLFAARTRGRRRVATCCTRCLAAGVRQRTRAPAPAATFVLRASLPHYHHHLQHYCPTTHLPTLRYRLHHATALPPTLPP